MEHVQRSESPDPGRKLGGIDTIASHLATDVFPERKRLDLEVSTEKGGLILNEGCRGGKSPLERGGPSTVNLKSGSELLRQP